MVQGYLLCTIFFALLNKGLANGETRWCRARDGPPQPDPHEHRLSSMTSARSHWSYVSFGHCAACEKTPISVASLNGQINLERPKTRLAPLGSSETHCLHCCDQASKTRLREKKDPRTSPEHVLHVDWGKTEVNFREPWKDNLSELNPGSILSNSCIYLLPVYTCVYI